MKANEFVKKFGWDKAKEVASFTSNVCADPTHFDSDLDIYVHFDDFKGVMDESDVCIADLKRLVESHELVERVGGLDRVKKALDGKHIGYTHFYLHSNDRYVFLDHYVDFIPDHAQHIGMFNKAIKDAEACKEVL